MLAKLIGGWLAAALNGEFLTVPDGSWRRQAYPFVPNNTGRQPTYRSHQSQP
jgi:hypothetical protein